MSAFNRKHATGTGADIILPMIKVGVIDFAVAADWTPAAGDVKISKDGGAAANIATLPVFLTDIGWKFVFSDAELTAARINVNIVDSATKAVEDQHFIIETYGNASAQHAFDLNLAEQLVALSATGKTDVNTEVDNALNTAIPGSPTADSINERVKAIDDKLPSGTLSDFDETADPVELLDTGGTAGTSASELVDDIWDEDINAAHQTADTAGKRLDDASTTVATNLDATVSSRSDFDESVDPVELLDSGGAAGTSAAELVDDILDEPLSGHVVAATVGASLQIIRSATAQAGAASTITLDASANATDDFYDNTVIQIIAGTGADQSRRISDYVGATKVATVDSAWVTNPDATSVFAILPSDAMVADIQQTDIDAIADGVWDEARAGHVSAGSFGEGVLVEDLNTAAKASVNVEVVDVMKVDTIPEQSQGIPPTNPTFEEVQAWFWATWRNDLTASSSQAKVRNNAGTVLAKAGLSDAAGEFQKDKFVSGP